MKHHQPDSLPKRTQAGPILIAVWLLALTACRTTKPEPFAQYFSAVQGVQHSTDSLLSIDHSWTRADFVDRFSSNTNSKFSSLLIQMQDDGSMKVGSRPLYLQIKEVRASLSELNQGFLDYMDLLVKLSTPGLISAAEFEQMAKDLNKQVSGVLRAADLGAPAEKAGLLSTAAIKLWQVHLENRRHWALKQALEANQETVAIYADRCAQLVHATKAGLLTVYTSQTEQMRAGWNNPANAKDRARLTENILTLNDEFMDLQRVVTELLAAYKTLPEAHQALSAQLSGSKSPAVGLQALVRCSQRLHRLDDELKNTKGRSK